MSDVDGDLTRRVTVENIWAASGRVDCSTVLKDLLATANYRYRVIAVGHGGSTECSEYKRFETIGIRKYRRKSRQYVEDKIMIVELQKTKHFSLAPEKPTRIAFQILAPTSLQVNWGEPPETNGQIIKYLVTYQEVNKENTRVEVELPSGHQRSLLLEDLHPDIEYLYTVKANNEWGWSQPRRARLAIQMNGSNPPSDYVMGATSTLEQSPLCKYFLDCNHVCRGPRNVN